MYTPRKGRRHLLICLRQTWYPHRCLEVPDSVSLPPLAHRLEDLQLLLFGTLVVSHVPSFPVVQAIPSAIEFLLPSFDCVVGVRNPPPSCDVGTHSNPPILVNISSSLNHRLMWY
jgi:hypothetical protein